MPFDAAAPATLEPTLRNLSLVLRHEELWPPGFKWDYSDCAGCALGLVSQMWRAGFGIITSIPEEARFFQIPRHIAMKIFYCLHYHSRKSRQDITPTDVADVIDAWLTAAAQWRTER
jgi:hypothetical protein